MTTTTITLTSSQAKTITGTNTGGLFLNKLLRCTLSKTGKGRDGWFYKSLREWRDEGISEGSVRKFTEILVSKGILSSYSERDYGRIYGGIRRWYKVNATVLQAAINSFGSLTEKTVKQVKKATESVKGRARQLYDEAITMGKSFTDPPKASTRPNTALQATSSIPVFTHINSPIIKDFSDFVSRKGGHKLKELFSRYGLNSHYVQKVLNEFIVKQNKTISCRGHKGAIDYPTSLNQPAWQQWLTYREGKLTYRKASTELVAINRFIRLCPDQDHQQEWITYSIAQQYKDLYAPPARQSQASRPTTEEFMHASQSDRFHFNFDDDEA